MTQSIHDLKTSGDPLADRRYGYGAMLRDAGDLAAAAAWLEGVDLSRSMIDRARAKRVFDALHLDRGAPIDGTALTFTRQSMLALPASTEVPDRLEDAPPATCILAG